MAGRSSATLLAAATLALGPGGCGGEDPAPTPTIPDRPAQPERVPRSEQQRVFGYQQAITSYCRELTVALRGRSSPPPAGERRRALRAAAELAEMTRARPFDLVQTGVDLRLFTGDLIEDLGNLDCEPRVVRRLEEGLG